MMKEEALRKLQKAKDEYHSVVMKRFLKYDNMDDYRLLEIIEAQIAMINLILEAV